MLYKFKSKAGADVIMLGPQGDQLLRLLGRAPAATGIFERADLLASIQALEQAVAASETDQAGQAAALGVSLRARMWPMVELMRRSAAAGHDVVWGV